MVCNVHPWPLYMEQQPAMSIFLWPNPSLHVHAFADLRCDFASMHMNCLRKCLSRLHINCLRKCLSRLHEQNIYLFRAILSSFLSYDGQAGYVSYRQSENLNPYSGGGCCLVQLATNQ